MRNLIIRLGLAAAVFVLLALPARAHNCGSPDDCRVAPANVARTTSLALVFSGLMLLWLLRIGAPPDSTTEELEGDEPLESMEDIFGSPTEPRPPVIDRPLGEDP